MPRFVRKHYGVAIGVLCVLFCVTVSGGLLLRHLHKNAMPAALYTINLQNLAQADADRGELFREYLQRIPKKQAGDFYVATLYYRFNNDSGRGYDSWFVSLNKKNVAKQYKVYRSLELMDCYYTDIEPHSQNGGFAFNVLVQTEQTTEEIRQELFDHLELIVIGLFASELKDMAPFPAFIVKKGGNCAIMKASTDRNRERDPADQRDRRRFEGSVPKEVG